MVVVALAAARFLLLPWAEAQVSQRARIELLTERLVRAQGVVRNKEFAVNAERDLGKRVEAELSIFPAVKDTGDFRLQFQTEIGQVAKSNGATVSLFEWLLDENVTEAKVSLGKVRLRMAGPLEKIVRAHGEIEGRISNVFVREFSLDSAAAIGWAAEEEVSANLILDVYYQPEVFGVREVSARENP